MSPNSHSISALSTAKKLNTPLKASVLLITAIMLSACGSDSGNYPYIPLKPTPTPDSDGATAAEKAKAEAAKAKAAAEAAAKKLVDAANAEAAAAKKAAEQAKADAEKAKADAEKAQNSSREEAAAAKKAAEEAEVRAKAAEEKAREAEEKSKAAVEKAKADADARVEEAQKDAAEAAKKSEEKLAAAEKAKADAIKAKEAAQKALEDALAAGGGDKEALQKEADRKALVAAAAQAEAEAAATAATAAQSAAQAEVRAAAAAQQAAKDALAAAAIKNAPETAKSGAQSLDINAGSIGLFKTTTNDFAISEDGTVVNARADLASDNPETEKVDGLLPQVPITTSGADDTQVANSNGFMSHKDSTSINALGMALPLTYTSTYKDFGNDEMRIGHINGSVAALGKILPVNGVVVIGNATEAANVPTEGKVGYTGEATYRELGQDKAIEFGTSVFNADFVAKNLKGDLTFSDKTIGLEAAIAGNQFSGSKDGYNADGGFFGGDAQYLGGVYEGNGAQGTYGAKSDKQTAAEKAAKDKKAQADAAEKALAAVQAEAAKAQAAAEQAQADAAKAKEAAIKAQEAADNAGTGGDDQALQDALDRAEAAEAAAKKAEKDADAAIQAAADAAQAEVKAAQDQAQLEVKAAQDKVTAAQSEATAAKESAAAALAAADAAEKDAVAKIAAAESAAAEDVATAEAAADKAIADAAKAQEELKQAQADTQVAEAKATQAQAEKLAAEQRAQELQDQLDALNNPDAYKSDAETEQSGVQHLSVDASGLGAGVKTTTTRDFTIRSTSDVDARADLALEGVLEVPTVAIQVSGDNDTDTENGFKAHEGTGNVLGEGDLAYTATYKDFGDNGEMRIAHIDGAVSAGGGAITVPVDGVAVVGNKTATLPTEGTFEYAGDATNRKVGLDNAIEYGSSEFTADFVNSKVDGTLKFAEAGEIGLSADIDGNEFSGAAADETGYNTEGAFYGKDANYIGGIYEGNGSQGTFGAEKDGTPADLVSPEEPEPEVPEPPVNPDAAVDAEFTGFQSNTLSSKKFLTITEDAIGYAEIRDDKSDFIETQTVDGSKVPVDNRAGDNFTSYDKFLARADMTKPDSVQKAVNVTLSAAGDTAYNGSEEFKLHTESTKVQGPVALDLNYSSVYKNFDSQMQIGHVYGDPKLGTTDLARVSTVYVQGNGTNLDDMQYMKDLAQYNIDNNINDGMVAYTGVATYMENLHLKDGARGGPVVDGSSKFDVDFVNSKLEGTLTFAEGDYKYMPAGNEININADITGNTFAGNANNIDTAGGFYGEDAQFLGGVYQEALERGGKGAQPGEGTTFQGTFGAEKQ